MSINTLNAYIWRNLEPASPHPQRRMQTVRELREAGLPAGIMMAPILPGLTDRPQEVTELIQAAVENDAQFIVPSFLRLSSKSVRSWFMQTIRRQYPELYSRYRYWYRQAHPPESYTGPVRRRIEQALRRADMDDGRLHRHVYTDGTFNKSSAESEEGACPIHTPQPIQLSFSF